MLRSHPDRKRPRAIEPAGRLHVALCVPCESLPIESVRCLTRAIRTAVLEPPRLRPETPIREFVLSEHYIASSMLPFARGRLCATALEVGATHIVMLDSDMTYPGDVIQRLVYGAERCGGFVAANCVTRRPPTRWTAIGLDGKAHASKPDSPRWTAVRSIGVAVACITATAYEKLEVPQFNFGHTPLGWVGEDIWFCERLRAAGVAVSVDNALALEVGHVGSIEYRPEHIRTEVSP
jgi:hypothetical protein